MRKIQNIHPEKGIFSSNERAQLCPWSLKDHWSLVIYLNDNTLP